MKYIILIIVILINGAFAQSGKKVVIQLYEDGTWQKAIDDSAKQVIPDIEKTWKLFQEAIKSKDKNKALDFFDFPIEVDICDIEQSKKDYKGLKGNYSKKKLLEKYDVLFNKKFIDAIDKVNSDEYAKRSKSNSYIFDFYKTQDYEFVYEIQFYLINNQYKIGVILIGYGK